MNQYDYIFAGSGCAALSLACAMQNTPLRNKKILLIDQDTKRQNDRTWCYWTAEPSPYDSIAKKVWHTIRVQTDTTNLHLPIAPYRYQMLRGIDFYEWAKAVLGQNAEVHWLQADISSIQNTTQGAIVYADGQAFTSQWVFNSLPPHINTADKQAIDWFQHFKGWFIRTEKPVFDESTATFMDFRTPQAGEVRFLYVLPTSPHEALVEFTVFGRQVMEQSAYLPPLQSYILQKLGLQASDYTITEEEFGVIPMTTRTFPAKTGSFIIQIGSAAGCTKASTGFTFQAIQQHTKKILASLLQYDHPLFVPKNPLKYALYDHILLNVLDKQRMQGSKIFEILFKKHPIQRILRFLDGDSSWIDELHIITSVPPLPFLQAALDIL